MFDNIPHFWNSKIKVYKDSIHILWGGPDKDWWYWLIGINDDYSWEYQGKTYHRRRWGFEKTWYDGPHAQLILYFIVIGWQTPWTNDKGTK